MAVFGVLWDYGNTLEDHTSADWRSTEHALFGRLYARLQEAGGFPLPTQLEDFRSAMRTAWDAWLAESAHELRELRIDELLIQVLHLPPSQDSVRKRLWDCIDACVREDEMLPPFPDTLAALERLRKAGLRQGVVSNTVLSHRSLCAFLARHSFLPFFDCVVSSADHGWVKPHGSIFARALGELGLEPEHVVFVGDNPVADVQGGQAAGMRAIWLRNGSDTLLPADCRPDAICDTRAQVAEVILSWCNGG